MLADHLFPTEFGGSFTAHLTLIAGTDDLDPTKAEADFPTASPDDCDSPPGTISGVAGPPREVVDGPFPCFTQFNTMPQRSTLRASRGGSTPRRCSMLGSI